MTKPNEREMELARDTWLFVHTLDVDDLALMFAAYRKELTPKWTREVPTVPGNYWHRFDRNGVATIKALYLTVEGLYLNCDDGWDMAADAHGGEWAGPIAEPEEP